MTAAALAPRRLLAPEVVQTSAMDCGPAALKCLLEGWHIRASYGRLREACQTSVDGSSIDMLEQVSQQLGLQAEQVMIPRDHLLLPQARSLPAIVVVRQGDGAPHFVVLWRRHGDWVQVMDPANGRRWLRGAQFLREVLAHEHSVAADDWREWAGSEEFLGPLRQRLAALGVPAAQVDGLLAEARRDSGWFGFGVLDAATRLVQALQHSGGLQAGAGGGSAAGRLVGALVAKTLADTEVIFRHIPAAYWAATPDPDSLAQGQLQLRLRGAVLVRVQGRLQQWGGANAEPLPFELRAALSEKPVHPLGTVWGALRADGLLAPLAVLGVSAAASVAVLMQTLLLRALFDVAWQLNLPSQRLAAWVALVGFVGVLLLLQLPLVMESLRLGRQLEMRLRIALLAKLPRLNDRYFSSRSISDMAERGHSIHLTRLVPGLGLQFLQTLAELLLTLGGIAWVAPASIGWALATAGLAMVLALAVQPLLAEHELRLRSHSTALLGFYLDALLGLVPVRAHGAAQAVRRQHEGLLVDWAQSGRRMLMLALSAGAAQSLLCLGLAGTLLLRHFMHAGAVAAADLLLVYWALKLPALGAGLMQLAQQYPAQRNVLLRLMEPLTAPEEAVEPSPVPAPAAVPASDGVALHIRDGRVQVAGHEILSQLNLDIAPGEHVAVVGASGAGKSSLVGLCLGWHKLAEGTLQADGQPLRSAALERLRRHTAWVDAGVQIWNRSLLDNLQYASDASDASQATRIGEVVAAAGLRELLRKLPQGLQTVLGEGGSLLSGGEGQRVRLARAMLQPGVRLALLDEPFRGLDRHQRRQLLADTRRWWAQATLLCVTHDIEETLSFPRVLVVQGGRVVEDGSPAALQAQGGCYAQMLQDEQSLHAQMWAGAHWRALQLVDGRLVEDPKEHRA